MRRTFIARLAAAVLAASAVAANAQPAPEDETPIDARLIGYTQPGENQPPTTLVIRPVAGTAGTWFIIAILGVVCFGAMCKNAKRTHLD